MTFPANRGSYDVMQIPFSCDTSVALGSATFDGSTIFAKNSDRSPNEAQPFIHLPRQQHPSGSMVRCQHIEIPEVAETWEIIGSRPCWLWGFEIGVNEWGVAIGNEAVHTREPSEDVSLIGMDIIRLALERATSADEATALIGDLIEQYGQGGSCEEHFFRTYHNSFIVADPRTAWIVETAGHRWAAKRVTNRAAIGNLLTLDTWDTSSPGLVEHATKEGWASAPFSFAASYQDPNADLRPRSCRLARSREILSGYSTPITVQDMMAVLTDHGDRDLPVKAEPLPTLCMHSCPGYPGETAAAMVAHLKPGRPRELTATVWTAFGSPCLSVFRPVYPFAVGLPESLNNGASTYSPDSPWWEFEVLQRIVAASPDLAVDVRTAFGELQQSFFAEAVETEAEAERLLSRGDQSGARALLRALVDDTTARALDRTRSLTASLAGDPRRSRNEIMTAFWNELNEKAGVVSPGALAFRLS